MIDVSTTLKIRYNIVGIAFPLIIAIVSFLLAIYLGTRYPGISVFLILVSFSSVAAFFVVLAKLLGAWITVHNVTEEEKKRKIKEYIEKMKRKEIENEE